MKTRVIAGSWQACSSRSAQKDFFIEGDFEILAWEAAKSELRRQDYRGGKQYRTGWLTIYTDDGGKLLTKPPTIDAFFELMKETRLPTEGFGTE